MPFLCAGGDLKTGYMEKRIGEHSTRQSLPESWKWQKRYWVLSEPKGLLYYFKSADDPPQYRGIINIRECRVEDVDANGMPKRILISLFFATTMVGESRT